MTTLLTTRQYWSVAFSAVFVFSTLFSFLARAQTPAAIPDKLELVRELRAGKYQKLEDYLTKLQDGYEAGDVPEKFVSIGFNAFGNSGRDLKDNLDNWVNQFPKSYAARMARGAYFFRLGFLAILSASVRDPNPEHVQRKTKFLAQAFADLELAIARKPKLTPAYGLLIGISLTEGNRQTAIELSRRALRDNPASQWVLSTFMWMLQPERGGSLDELEKFLSQAGDEKKKYNYYPELGWHRYLAYANGLFQIGRYKDAIGVCSEGLRRFKARELFHRRGVYYQQVKRDDKAIEDFTRALELYPQYERYLVARAESYLRANFGERALADLNLALKLNPLNPHSLNLRAGIYRSRFMYSHALRDLRNAMEYGSHDPKISKARADLYGRILKEPRVALDEFSKIVRQNPHSEQNWMDFYDAVRDYGIWFFKKKQKCQTAALYTLFLNVCRASEVCMRKTYRMAAMVLVHMVLEINCPAKPAPQKAQP